MSPTAPTFVTLNSQLNRAHRRIRELEARETELVAHNTTLCAVIEELTEEHPRTTADVAPASNTASAGGSATGANRGKTRRFPYV